MIQTVVVTVLKPFLVVPEVVLEVGLPNGEEERNVFALPVVLSQFMRPLRLYPAALLQLWFDGGLHSRLTALRLAPAVAAAGAPLLQQIVSLGGKLGLVCGVRHRLAENSLLAAGEFPAIGDMQGDCRALVRLWRGPHPAAAAAAAAAKLEVKAQDPRVAASLYELLVYLLEGSE